MAKNKVEQKPKADETQEVEQKPKADEPTLSQMLASSKKQNALMAETKEAKIKAILDK